MSVLAERSSSNDSPKDQGRVSDALEARIQQVIFCPCCGEAAIVTPRFVCGECESTLDVKCQVFQSGGVWYAECLTLNLLSKGDDKVDAIRRLQVAMFSYAATVLREGESAAGLIPRSAPASSWIAYYFRSFFARLAYLFGRKSPALIQAMPIEGGAVLKVAHCP